MHPCDTHKPFADLPLTSFLVNWACLSISISLRETSEHQIINHTWYADLGPIKLVYFNFSTSWNFNCDCSIFPVLYKTWVVQYMFGHSVN